MKKYYDKKCKCGCGRRIKIRECHSWNGIPDYISGHNSRLYSLSMVRLANKVNKALINGYYDKFCFCGCGKRIVAQKHHKIHGIPDFIRNHHMNVLYYKKKISLANSGKRMSKKNKLMLSFRWKENNPMWNKDIKKRVVESISGENNCQWKGDNVSHRSLHEWIGKRKKKPIFCEKCCKKRKLELSNISGRYYRNINDYRWLCHSCHVKFDKKRGVQERLFIKKRFGWCNSYRKEAV